MKANNSNQRRVVELSTTLPPINDKHTSYAFKKCFNHLGFRTKKGVICMECGHEFVSEQMKCNCPKCSTLISLIDTRKHSQRDNHYMSIITTCEEFQVIRTIDVIQVYRKGDKANYQFCEVVQNWISDNGNVESISRMRAYCFSYNYTWAWNSKLELRKTNNSHHIGAKCIYPQRKYIDIIKRNGFKGNFCGFAPLSLFTSLLNDTKSETLFKAKQYDMLGYFMSHSYYVNELWPIVKICLRNKYYPKNVNVWKDYIDLLKHFKMDVMNAKFACPANLNQVHKLLVAKRKKQRDFEDKQRESQREEERKVKHEENLRIFNDIKSKYFGLEFSDKLIHVKVLESLKEYEQEGLKLDHCVFENEYYGKPETLILSARINDEPIETIEISLDKFEVVQCSGYDNKNTEYHDRIIKLVNSNIGRIRQRKEKLTA